MRKLVKDFQPGESAVFRFVGKHIRQQEATYLDFADCTSSVGGAVA